MLRRDISTISHETRQRYLSQLTSRVRITRFNFCISTFGYLYSRFLVGTRDAGVSLNPVILIASIGKLLQRTLGSDALPGISVPAALCHGNTLTPIAFDRSECAVITFRSFRGLCHPAVRPHATTKHARRGPPCVPSSRLPLRKERARDSVTGSMQASMNVKRVSTEARSAACREASARVAWRKLRKLSWEKTSLEIFTEVLFWQFHSLASLRRCEVSGDRANCTALLRGSLIRGRIIALDAQRLSKHAKSLLVVHRGFSNLLELKISAIVIHFILQSSRNKLTRFEADSRPRSWTSSGMRTQPGLRSIQQTES